jgi:hypothetical protein
MPISINIRPRSADAIRGTWLDADARWHSDVSTTVGYRHTLRETTWAGTRAARGLRTMILNDASEAVGRTPLVHLRRLSTDAADAATCAQARALVENLWR